MRQEEIAKIKTYRLFNNEREEDKEELVNESPSLAIANRAQTLKRSRKENIGTAIVFFYFFLCLVALPEEVGLPQNPRGCTFDNVELLRELYDEEVIMID